MRHIDWSKGETSIGEYSRMLHSFKHAAENRVYEDQTMRFLAKTLPEHTCLLDYDMDYKDPVRRQALAEKYHARIRAMQASGVTKKMGLPTPAEGRAERLRHVQDGRPRRTAPWVPPFMRTPATAPNSPGCDGLLGTQPSDLKRVGGGYCEAHGPAARIAGCGTTAHFYGPPLKTSPRRSSPQSPSITERALWIGGLPRSAGANRLQKYDKPRDKRVYLNTVEASVLYEENDLPAKPEGAPCEIVPASLPQLQKPVRRPTFSKDLYRLYQFMAADPLVM